MAQSVLGSAYALLITACCVTAAYAQPATQPTTAPATTRPTITLYTCLLGNAGIAFTGHAVGDLPVLQQVEPEYIAAKAGYAKRQNAGIFVDYETPRAPQPGIAATRDLAQLAGLDAYVREMGRLLREAKEAAGIEAGQSPRRLVGVYTDLPIGRRWQYDDDQTAYIADNRRVAAAEPFRGADFVGVHAYLHNDDFPNMTPQLAMTLARRRIAAARFYGKPIMLFITPSWVHAKPARDVSDELIRALLTVAREEQLDVCLWSDAARDAVEARRQAMRVSGIVNELNQ